jgi:hypothetical protein
VWLRTDDGARFVGLGRIERLPVLARDLAPLLAPIPQVAERLLDEPVALALGRSSSGWPKALRATSFAYW